MVTDVTDFDRKSGHTRAHAHAHGQVTENSVTICHLSPDADAKRYAVCEADEPVKRVYTPADRLLEPKQSVRFAALDVMILTFAATRHAQWLARLGVCPPDVAEQIRNHISRIEQIISVGNEPSPKANDVSARSSDAVRGERGTGTRSNATRRNVGKRPATTGSLFNNHSHNGASAPSEGQEKRRSQMYAHADQRDQAGE